LLAGVRRRLVFPAFVNAQIPNSRFGSFELTRRRQELRPVESASVRHVVYLAAIDRASDDDLIADTVTHTCSAAAEYPTGAAQRGGSVLHSSFNRAGEGRGFGQLSCGRPDSFGDRQHREFSALI